MESYSLTPTHAYKDTHVYACIHIPIYLKKKKKVSSCSVAWVDHELIILGSQTCDTTPIFKIKKEIVLHLYSVCYFVWVYYILLCTLELELQ